MLIKNKSWKKISIEISQKNLVQKKKKKKKKLSESSNLKFLNAWWKTIEYHYIYEVY